MVERTAQSELTATIDPSLSPWSQLRVLDLTWMAAGPVITSFLSHLGADVIKVESRRRLDLMRIANKSYGWADDDDIETSPIFNELAAGKRSISLDLKTDDGRHLLRQLALKSDILVENMRPGKVESLGLDFASLHRDNPGLIMCSMSAHGRVTDQPMPGYAPIFWAEGGAAWLSGWPEGDPCYVRGPVDLHAGAFTTFAMIAALIDRDITGQGCHIDCSGIEAVATLAGIEILATTQGLPDRGRVGNEAMPYVPNDVFPTRGEYRWVAISVRDDQEWARLVEILGISEGDGKRFSTREARWRQASEVYSVIASTTREWQPDELVARLLAAGVPAAISRTLEDALDDQSLHARGFWVEIEHERIGRQTIAGLPWVTRGLGSDGVDTSRAPRLTDGAPLLGADTDEVLHGLLGLGSSEIEELRSMGVLT